MVGQAATTTTITSDNPDPSVVGQTITVTYTVTVNPPGAGTPTGMVTVSDGVNCCMGTVAAGSCNVALLTAGARTLTATYAGDANFLTSNDTEPHQVNMANTTTTITAESADPTAQGEVFTVFYSVAVTAPGGGNAERHGNGHGRRQQLYGNGRGRTMQFVPEHRRNADADGDVCRQREL